MHKINLNLLKKPCVLPKRSLLTHPLGFQELNAQNKKKTLCVAQTIPPHSPTQAPGFPAIASWDRRLRLGNPGWSIALTSNQPYRIQALRDVNAVIVSRRLPALS